MLSTRRFIHECNVVDVKHEASSIVVPYQECKVEHVSVSKGCWTFVGVDTLINGRYTASRSEWFIDAFI